VVVINLPEKKSTEVFQKLYESHGIACASTVGIRMSPHVYNSMADVEKLVQALSTLAA
jgi:isopenicillin-N epimerase